MSCNYLHVVLSLHIRTHLKQLNRYASAVVRPCLRLVFCCPIGMAVASADCYGEEAKAVLVLAMTSLRNLRSGMIERAHARVGPRKQVVNFYQEHGHS